MPSRANLAHAAYLITCLPGSSKFVCSYYNSAQNSP